MGLRVDDAKAKSAMEDICHRVGFNNVQNSSDNGIEGATD